MIYALTGIKIQKLKDIGNFFSFIEKLAHRPPLDIAADNNGYMWRLVRSAEDPENNDVSAVGCNVIVVGSARANLFTESNK